MKTGYLMALALLATSVAVARAERMPVSDVLEGMETTWKSVDSYSCRMKSWGTRDGKEKTESFTYYFKKPRLVRLKVLSGKDKGADVVYGADGKVRAGKRVLGIFVTQSIGTNDKKVYSARGVPFWNADLGTQIAAVRTLIKEKGASATADRASGVITLKLSWKGTDLNTDTGVHEYVRTYTLDAKTFTLTDRVTTEDGTTVERLEVSDMNLKAGLEPGFFRL
jgi:outer membrane lipoprotein-sorting protein